jgi:(2R)-sulfolactate sulfo-lyase subunit alpha
VGPTRRPQGRWSAIHKFLVHNEGDDVGVATEDIDVGDAIVGIFMDTGGEVGITARGAVPLSHKIAVRALKRGDEVTEYGTRVGIATGDIEVGDYVHTHNIRSARW